MLAPSGNDRTFKNLYSFSYGCLDAKTKFATHCTLRVEAACVNCTSTSRVAIASHVYSQVPYCNTFHYTVRTKTGAPMQGVNFYQYSYALNKTTPSYDIIPN